MLKTFASLGISSQLWDSTLKFTRKIKIQIHWLHNCSQSHHSWVTKSGPNVHHFVKHHWLLHIWLTCIVILMITARSNKEVVSQILSGHFKSLTISQRWPQKRHNSLPHELFFSSAENCQRQESPEKAGNRQWKMEEQRENIYKKINK